MPVCPKCQSAITEGQKHCPGCGAEIAAVERTVTSPQPPKGSATSPPSTSSGLHGRFEPGTMLGTRYRVVGLLGRGGMGEVYRADDLELGQSVALKFLPPRLATDEVAKQRFRNEVRTARQVAHPNVCRMYDIGEADGNLFLSMEYIDGEDLAQVLRRMGRPTTEKALEITRQLCLGLATAHENGVLHRDLKPANIMIDGRGRVRITDFGLAGLVDQFSEGTDRAGTPAYMAPEQLASGSASVRSDIYALGLVLYELFTGRRLFDTNNVADLKRLHASTSVASLSTVSEDLDPAVERVILRCLEKDPKQRPSSVYAVLGALPGGDPLAAALAAGETPSPELLAEAGDPGGLSPAVAMACLVAALVLLVGNVWINSRTSLYHYVALDTPQEELAVRARDILRDLGHNERLDHRAHGFSKNQAYIKYISDHDKSQDRWDRLSQARPPALVFWYRTGPDSLIGTGLHMTGTGRHNPPLSGRGSAILELDPSGTLVHLAVITGAEPYATSDEFAPKKLFALAGLNYEYYESTEIVKTPPVLCDRVVALHGPYTGIKDEGVTVQCGAYGGRATYFEIVGPWNTPAAENEGGATPTIPTFAALIALSIIFAALVLAHRNLKSARGDRKGAFRLAVFIVATMMAAWLITGMGAPGSIAGIIQQLIWDKPIGHALHHACIAWLLYIALEPYARRLWPRTLVSWTRLLVGRFRDPQVGREILVGGILAGITGILLWAQALVSARLGVPPAAPLQGFLGQIGLREQLGRVIDGMQAAIVFPMIVVVALVVIRLLVRRNWAAIAGFLLLVLAIGAIGTWVSNEPDPMVLLIGTTTALFTVGITVAILIRFGLVALIASDYVSQMLRTAPVVPDLSQWYAGPVLVPLVACTALMLYGFYISLAGRPLLRDEILEA